MNENQITAFSVCGSLVCLVAIYIFVSHAVPESVNICDITPEYAGRIVGVTGTISDFGMNEGNAFFTLSDGRCEIKAVLWEGVISGMEMRGNDPSLMKDGVNVSLSGEVGVHAGYLQIVPTRPDVEMGD